MRISDKIELLRKQRGISLTHLNNAIGAYRGKITDVRAGKSSFSEEEIFLLAKELNTSADYLLGNTDNPAPAQGAEAAPLPFQLTHEARELLDIFFSLGKTGQDGLLQYARFLTTQQADTPTAAKSHLA